jgi:hypothetical protein
VAFDQHGFSHALLGHAFAGADVYRVDLSHTCNYFGIFSASVS